MLPEHALHEKGVPRPLFLIIASSIISAVMFVCAFVPLPGLLLASFFGGLSFGSFWGLMPALASEAFGLRHFASNYSLFQVNHFAVRGDVMCCALLTLEKEFDCIQSGE